MLEYSHTIVFTITLSVIDFKIWQ